MNELAKKWRKLMRGGGCHLTGMMNCGRDMADELDALQFQVNCWRERALFAEEMERREAETLGYARDFIEYLLKDRGETW